MSGTINNGLIECDDVSYIRKDVRATLHPKDLMVFRSTRTANATLTNTKHDLNIIWWQLFFWYEKIRDVDIAT
jgi:hypothetical protein